MKSFSSLNNVSNIFWIIMNCFREKMLVLSLINDFHIFNLLKQLVDHFLVPILKQSNPSQTRDLSIIFLNEVTYLLFKLTFSLFKYKHTSDVLLGPCLTELRDYFGGSSAWIWILKSQLRLIGNCEV